MTRRVALFVPNATRPTCVGKVFSVTDPATLACYDICCHETAGSQYVRKYNSPGGIDLIVLAYLVENGVRMFHHVENPSRRLWTASVRRILDVGKRDQLDGRDRVFLPLPRWSSFPRPWYEIPQGLPALTLDDWELVPEDNPVRRMAGGEVRANQPSLFDIEGGGE